jgi:hypothetical protein
VRRVFQLVCRFLVGMIIGLTTLMLVAVLSMATVIYRIPSGIIGAVVLGCAGSGFLYMMVLWSYGADYEHPEKKSSKKKDRDLEGTGEPSAGSAGMVDDGKHGSHGTVPGSEETDPGEA